MDSGIQRPPSDKDIDIHVLIVPASLWRADLRFAYSSTCLESVSSGFVRVYPSTPLCALRKEIARQLDLSLLPDGYVFLRNVGRHLTWVTAKQESKLQAKLFVPPLAPCPELYILDARCLKDWLPLGDTSSQYSQKKGRHLHNNSYSYPASTEVQSCGQTTEGLAGTYLSIHSHQHPVTTTQHPPLRAHHSNLVSHPLHTQTPHHSHNLTSHLPNSSQESSHHNLTYTHGQAIKHAKNLNTNAAAIVHQKQKSRHLSYHNFTSHPNQLPNSIQEPSHHNLTYTHGQATKHAKNPNTKAAAIVQKSRRLSYHNFTSHPNQLPNSIQESPHHNLAYTHGQATKHATLSKNPNTNAAAAVHQRRKSRRISLQAPQSTVPGSGTGHHSTTAVAGGSYRLLHQEEIHRRDHGSLKNCTTNSENLPSKMTTPCSNASSLKYPPTNSYERTMEATVPTTSQVNLVHTGTGNGTDEDQSGSSSESSEGEPPYHHALHDRMSPNHPMVTQATDAIEKALYGNGSGKNGVGIARKHRGQFTDHRGARDGDRPEPVAEDQVYNEPQQQTDHQPFSRRGIQSPLENITEIGSKVAGSGQDKVAHVTFSIPQQNTRDSHNDLQRTNRLRSSGALRVQSSGREKVQGVRTRIETHPPKETARKVFDRREFEHTDTMQGTSNSIPSEIPAHHDRSTNLHSSLLVAFKIPSERADFSPTIPLPPINKRTAESSSAHLSASNSVPLASEVNDLLARIRVAKQECGELQQTKANLGTSYRNLQLLLKTQREDADKEWKRRFFQEKKVTASLEDRIKGVKGEIQALQVKLDKQRESRMKDLIHGTAPLTETPSQHSNIKIQCRRLELSIQELKQTLVTTRQRLAVEQEAHKAVLGECRALRRECMGKKIACTRTRGHPVIQHS